MSWAHLSSLRVRFAVFYCAILQERRAFFTSEDADVVLAHLWSRVSWRPPSNEIKNYTSPGGDR